MRRICAAAASNGPYIAGRSSTSIDQAGGRRPSESVYITVYFAGTQDAAPMAPGVAGVAADKSVDSDWVATDPLLPRTNLTASRHRIHAGPGFRSQSGQLDV